MAEKIFPQTGAKRHSETLSYSSTQDIESETLTPAQQIAEARDLLRNPEQKALSDRRAGLLRQALTMGDCYPLYEMTQDAAKYPVMANTVESAREVLQALVSELCAEDVWALRVAVQALTDRAINLSRCGIEVH